MDEKIIAAIVAGIFATIGIIIKVVSKKLKENETHLEYHETKTIQFVKTNPDRFSYVVKNNDMVIMRYKIDNDKNLSFVSNIRLGSKLLRGEGIQFVFNKEHDYNLYSNSKTVITVYYKDNAGFKWKQILEWHKNDIYHKRKLNLRIPNE